jgi:hypothetical protein
MTSEVQRIVVENALLRLARVGASNVLNIGRSDVLKF